MDNSDVAKLIDALVEYQAYFNATPAGMFVYAEDGTVLKVNETACRLHGFSQEEMLSMRPQDFIAPESHHIFEEFRAALSRGDSYSGDARGLRRDGSRFEAEVDGRLVEVGGRKLLFGSVLDVTEKKSLAAQLEATRRLEAIGQLAGGIAHDFNNLLSIILGNLELMQETAGADTDALIQPCIDAALRGAELTRNILSFARQASLAPQPVDMNEIVDRTTSWIARTLPASIELVVETDPGVLTARTDPGGAENALLNLVINARDAMAGGGRLTIETGNFTVDAEDEIAVNEGISPGHYVLVTITDTGAGIPKAHLPMVFEPFFSTKDETKGSGLGLSMVHGFMKQSGGEVRVYSEPGIGTTFKLFFPALDEKPGAAAPVPEALFEGPVGDARVLVVEDEADVRAVMVKALQGAGYEVAAVANGERAVEEFAAQGGFHAVVTDLVMPGALQGPALAKVLRDAAPDLAIVFVSGYAKDAVLHTGDLRSDDIRLMKPMRKRDLLAAVGRALAMGRTQDDATS